MPEDEDQARELIRKQIMDAFRPLECRAKIWDYKDKIKFKLLDEGKPVYEVPSVQINDLIASPDGFRLLKNRWRQRVRKRMRKRKPNFEFADPDF